MQVILVIYKSLVIVNYQWYGNLIMKQRESLPTIVYNQDITYEDYQTVPVLGCFGLD